MLNTIRKAAVISTVALSTICAAGLIVSSSAYAEDMKGDMKGDAKGGMHGDMKGDQAMGAKDIIDTATGPGMTEVTTLVQAVQAAGLVDTLKGKGPFTVFAPVNSAFAKLPAGTLENLLKPENKEQLKSILLYHVHAGAAVKAADVKTMKLSTAQGGELDIKVDGGTVTVNGAKVIKTDVVASNGIIHWIDGVVLPPASMK